MTGRRPFIPPRRPVFVGCEGESEVSYVRLLQDLIAAEGKAIHLIIENLGIGASEPQTRVELAVRKLEQLRRTRMAPQERFVLLDQDQADTNPQRTEAARRLARAHSIQIVWQKPCFEAMLLRHLPQCASRRPQTSADAGKALKREWPEYLKPMTRLELGRKIDRGAVLRAAAVEQELQLLLTCVQLVR
ncbi:MAG TPA: RloB domain-containing protein [Steroidobacteraceae bacterium]|nr:RloB domain-containing protein [Steroidobacteraceae bacterium]